MSCRCREYDVVLEDINTEQLGRATALIQKNMQRQAGRGLIKEEEIAPALKRIDTSQSLEGMRDRDLVIEAATEDEAVKKKIFRSSAQDYPTRR